MDENLNVTKEKEEELIRNKAIMKGKVTFTIIVIILIIIGVIAFFIIKANKSNEPVDKEVKTYKEIDGKITFLNQENQNLISYTCKSTTCKIEENSFDDLISIKSVIINEIAQKKYIIYNYETNKSSNSYTKIEPITINNEIYFIYQSVNYGILDKNGEGKINATYQSLEKVYNKDYFISKINNKYGIIDINNTNIIENIYDDINPIEDYLIATLNGKKIILDYSGNKLTDEADYINIVDKYFFTQDNNDIKLYMTNEEIFNFNLKDMFDIDITNVNHVLYMQDDNSLNIRINDLDFNYNFDTKELIYLNTNKNIE